MQVERQRTSLGRIVVTPLILMIAGYLIGGLPGVLIAAIVGLLYVAYASSRNAPQVPFVPQQEGGQGSIKDLSALAELRDRGVITVEEFEAKKRDLLARV